MFNSRITSDALMHSNVSIQIDSQETHPAFLSSSREISMSSRHVQILLQASNLCTNIHDHCKTVPKRIPSHSIHEYHCKVLSIHQSTTKMTLQQLDRPIGAVSPEYSSNDRITNSKLTPKRMLAKKTLQSRIGTIPTKQVPYTIPLQLVCSNMHKARSFPRSPAENSQYFHTPFRGKLRQSMAPLKRILLQSQNCFNPLPAPLRRSARIKRYPYPQTSMVTRRVAQAVKKNSSNKAVTMRHFLASSVHAYTAGDDT